MFNWPKEEGNELELRCTNKFATDEVTYISGKSVDSRVPQHRHRQRISGNSVLLADEIGLHRVENPSFTDKAVSLHLYSPPFEECGSFDQRTGHKNVCKVTFYSKYGSRTPFKVKVKAKSL